MKKIYVRKNLAGQLRMQYNKNKILYKNFVRHRKKERKDDMMKLAGQLRKDKMQYKIQYVNEKRRKMTT